MGNSDDDQPRPSTVKELRPWQPSSAAVEFRHPLLQGKSKRCWPAPPNKNVSYFAAREGAENDEDDVEVEFDDEEAYLAGTSRPGEEEASLTSGGTSPNSKSRRAVVLKQFKGCVKCLVN